MAIPKESRLVKEMICPDRRRTARFLLPMLYYFCLPRAVELFKIFGAYECRQLPTPVLTQGRRHIAADPTN